MREKREKTKEEEKNAKKFSFQKEKNRKSSSSSPPSSLLTGNVDPFLSVLLGRRRRDVGSGEAQARRVHRDKRQRLGREVLNGRALFVASLGGLGDGAQGGEAAERDQILPRGAVGAVDEADGWVGAAARRPLRGAGLVPRASSREGRGRVRGGEEGRRGRKARGGGGGRFGCESPTC